MKVLLSGYEGHMGKEVRALAENGFCGAEITAGVDINAASPLCVKTFEEADGSEDVIVDFSHHSLTMDLLNYAIRVQKPLILATTGQTAEEKTAILDAAGKIPVFFAANYSLGIALLIDLAKKTAATMKDAEIEIIEQHHNRKLDAPSGTALAIADGIKEVRPDSTVVTGRSGNGKRTPNEIGIHAIRMGNIVGIHEVMIGTPNQTITLKHEAHSRALFAEGALMAARFMLDKGPGLYDMKSMING